MNWDVLTVLEGKQTPLPLTFRAEIRLHMTFEASPFKSVSLPSPLDKLNPQSRTHYPLLF